MSSEEHDAMFSKQNAGLRLCLLLHQDLSIAENPSKMLHWPLESA